MQVADDPKWLGKLQRGHSDRAITRVRTIRVKQHARSPSAVEQLLHLLEHRRRANANGWRVDRPTNRWPIEVPYLDDRKRLRRCP
jgi:hypothetical protein